MPVSTEGILKPRLFSVLAAIALLVATTNAAVVHNVNWVGGSATWNTPAKWSGGVVPNNSGSDEYNVTIDGNDGVTSTVTNDISNLTVSSLRLSSSDVLVFGNSSTFTSTGTTSISGAVRIPAGETFAPNANVTMAASTGVST